MDTKNLIENFIKFQTVKDKNYLQNFHKNPQGKPETNKKEEKPKLK